MIMGRTQRLQCSSFLVVADFLLRGYSILPKKELHSSLSVEMCLNVLGRCLSYFWIYLRALYIQSISWEYQNPELGGLSWTQ